MDIHHDSQLELSPEVWLRILHIALEPDVDPRADEYTPFIPNPEGEMGAHVALAAQLVRVCRSWYALLLPTLCRDIRLGKGSVPLLQHARRVVLPYTSTDESTVEQLRQCSEIKTLCRPYCSQDWRANYNQDVPPAIPLPSLERLEFYMPEKSQHVGINSLGNVLLQTPNLRYLYFESLAMSDYLPYLDMRIELPLLETLRVYHMRGYIVEDLLSVWVLPALKTLILDNPVIHANLQRFWSLAGRTLTRVELGPVIQFMNHDYLGLCLENCPVLEDLGYFICLTNLPDHRQSHPTLRRIRLHLGHWADIFKSVPRTLLREHLIEFHHSGMQSLATFYIHGSEYLDAYTSGFDWEALKKQIATEGREIVLHR